MNELALFAGSGGGILGGHLLGWRTVCAVERDAYAASVLAQGQNDGYLQPFPIWSDVESFDGRPWRGVVDVVSAGFPCQDISKAGKGAGRAGERSGLWSHMAGIVREIRPRFVFVENSPVLTSRRLGRVLGDWPRWGSRRNGVSYLPPPLALPIFASGSGLSPTPTASDWRGSTGDGSRYGTLAELVAMRDGQASTGKAYPHPMLCERVMGWPTGWTELEPLGTSKFHKWQQQHSPFSLPKQMKAAA